MIQNTFKVTLALLFPPMYFALYRNKVATLIAGGMWLLSFYVLTFLWAGPGIIGLILLTGVSVYMALDFMGSKAS